MHFDRLRLTGFKSFVEPTEVVIGPGLNGVVGPNGCGKSNLLEALRWAMGESSYKSMRASGMDDVIFAGSADRPARNMAEVTLVMDNSARTAPAAFNDQDTLEITRRIEREAGSIYRINGKEVRARDVQLLFADASTGARSPALVRQGQIGELVNAKPQSRRRILEEAAGIAGLHARRHEADLRLNGAETNLERLEDVINTHDVNLQGLKKQARQASRYKNLSGEIRKAEGTQVFVRWREAAELVASEEESFAKVSSAIADLTGKAARASTLQGEIHARLPPLRTAEAEAAAGLHRLEVEREGLDAETQRLKARLEELTGRREQIAADLARERDNAGETAKLIERLAAEESELDLAARDHDAAVETASAELVDAKAALDAHEADLEARQSEANKLATEKAALERALSERANRIASADAQRQAALGELEALAPATPAGAETASLAGSVEAIAEKLAAAEAGAADTEAALGQLREAEAAAREALMEADREARRIETEMSTLRKVLRVEAEELWPPLIDAVSVKPGYEAALGAALGDDLDASGDIAAPVHWDQLPPVDPGQALPDGAEPLSAHVSAPAALARRLSQIGVVADSRGKALQAQLLPGQRLVSKEGGLWRWDGFSAAADAPTAAAQRLAQRNRLEGLENDARAANAEAGEKRTALDHAAAALKTGETQASAAREAWRETSRALGEAREALSEKERANTDARARESALRETARRLEGEVEAARADHGQAQAALAEARDPDMLAGDLAAAREALANARLRHTQAHAASESLGARAEQRARRLADIAAERQSWHDRAGRAEEQIETLSARAQGIAAEAEKIANAPDIIEEKRKRLMDAISEAQGRRRAAADALAEAETALAEADRGAKHIHEQLTGAREGAARSEERLDGARGRMRELSAALHDALGVNPDKALDALGIAGEDKLPGADDIERRVNRLRAERERLGGVNLRAEEEAEALATQLGELTGERDDLVQAIAKLRGGIGSLNREGRKRLLDAFKTVNANFERLFTTLFSGGEARLELTESDDPLEAGLEIMVRPPGKRLQHLSLMSGGEKALTATALIFAVFLTNPSPICVLDEVDAPLDDTNVARFCDLLDEMRKTTDTRFIVITHHPYSMARMNRLFGVTMGERGVSQIVSVDLEEAARLQQAS